MNEEKTANGTGAADPTSNTPDGGENKETTDEAKVNQDYEQESIFNVKKPKDIRDGLLNGAGNILKGTSLFILLILFESSQ